MLKTLQDLLNKRAKIVEDARKILDTAQAAKRGLTADEETNYQNLDKEIDSLNGQIQVENRTLELERLQLEGENQRLESQGNAQAQASGPRNSEEYRRAFRAVLQRGQRELTPEEQRALSAGSDIAGGYLVPPEQFVTQLIQAVDDLVFMRPLATKFQVANAASLGVAALETDPADADWTSEILTGSEDTAMAFGKRELHPHPLAKLLKVSNKLLRSAGIDPEALVRLRLAYKFAISEEKAFLSGTGAQQPLGVFTASANGISTGRDVSTGNTTTEIRTDGLIEAKFTLKPQYWPRARWLFHRNGVKQIRKLKDGEGNYLWERSIAAGQPDRILELPYLMSEYAPSTFTTGLYVGMVRDFSFYWIADALSMTLQRLVELYAAANQVGFIGRLECDGMPVLEEAFVRVKLA